MAAVNPNLIEAEWPQQGTARPVFGNTRLTGLWNPAAARVRIIAIKLAPVRARAMTWNGAGGCVIFSHDL